VVRTDRLRLVLDIPEVAAPHVTAGSALRFTVDALPGARFEGHLSRTAGSLRSDTRSMRAELDVDNSDGRLTAGMYATVHLELREFVGSLSIPATAVRRDRGESYVLVADGGLLRKVPVSILLDDGAKVVVSGALAPSAAVVVAGPASMTEGRRVTVEER
jgi:RND family efflux transporter MFP subunit